MEVVTFQLEIEPENADDAKMLSNRPAADFFAYSGPITDLRAETFRNVIDAERKADKVCIALCTNGGSADAAYRMARHLKRRYKDITLTVLGDCKSAGTLLALAADTIVMDDRGEFGPLDVQLFQPDEFMQMSSGLAISQALESLSERAFSAFEDAFLKIRQRSGGNITTKTASEIAAALSDGLFSSITEKIDPMFLGEIHRAMDIALHYGRRLDARDEVIRHLTGCYPSHSFVIDIEEAKELFDSVRTVDPFEGFLWQAVRSIMREQYKADPLRWQDDAGLLVVVKLDVKKEKKHEGSPRRNRAKRKAATKQTPNQQK